MKFDPCNYFLKIQKSIEVPTPKVGAHLGVSRFIPSHSPILSITWNVIPRLHSWLAPLQAFALVTSLRLGLWQLGTFHIFSFRRIIETFPFPTISCVELSQRYTNFFSPHFVYVTKHLWSNAICSIAPVLITQELFPIFEIRTTINKNFEVLIILAMFFFSPLPKQ